MLTPDDAYVSCTTLYGSQRRVPRSALRFRPSVYALIVNQGQLLVVGTRSTGRLFLPGGAVELGEPALDALKREVREETGITIEVGQLLHWSESFFHYDPTGESWHGLLLFFVCQAQSYTLSQRYQVDGDEAEQPRWADLQALHIDDFQEAARDAVQLLQTRLGC